MMYPVRCNRRDCQARRNLPKHPAEYRKWPRCRACGQGKVYIDEYRLRRGAKDHPPVCKDTQCDYLYQRLVDGGKYLPFHRVSTKGCSGYEDYVIAASMANSKHSPIKPHDGDEVPF